MLREFLGYLTLELYRSRLTVEAYETDLRGFNEYLIESGVPTDDAGFFIVEAVTTADIREWVARLTEEGLGTASIRRKIQSLRAFFKFAVKRGFISANPASSVFLPRLHRSLPKIAGHSDIEGCIWNASTLLEALIIELLYGCGLRRAELLAINDVDINIYSRELKILGKGNKHRLIPLPEKLVEDITLWQKERDALYPDLPEPKPLMATSRGRMSKSTLYNIVRNALSATNAEKRSPHTLRHSFATQLLNSGAEINSVRDLLGHSSLAATQIYTHVAFSELTRDWKKAHPRAKN